MGTIRTRISSWNWEFQDHFVNSICFQGDTVVTRKEGRLLVSSGRDVVVLVGGSGYDQYSI